MKSKQLQSEAIELTTPKLERIQNELSIALRPHTTFPVWLGFAVRVLIDALLDRKKANKEYGEKVVEIIETFRERLQDEVNARLPRTLKKETEASMPQKKRVKPKQPATVEKPTLPTDLADLEDEHKLAFLAYYKQRKKWGRKKLSQVAKEFGYPFNTAYDWLVNERMMKRKVRMKTPNTFESPLSEHEQSNQEQDVIPDSKK